MPHAPTSRPELFFHNATADGEAPMMRMLDSTSLIDEDDALPVMLRTMGVLAPHERIVGVSPAGDGNMNVTLRVTTTTRSVIIKQSRPFVAKYPSIPAPIERTAIEHCFYRAIAGLPGVADRMPRVVAYDDVMHALALQDLGTHTDLSAMYHGVVVSDAVIDALASYLATLHTLTRGSDVDFPSNTTMRRLNHQHIFVIPLDPGNGLDLDAYEPDLRTAASPLYDDPLVRARFGELGERYLSHGSCLIHGDFFPGSWLDSPSGIRIIDPEFAFVGDAEFDIGVALAHFRIADASGDVARRWFDAALEAQAKSPAAAALDRRLIIEIAAVEIIRRIIGVAQLPLGRSSGRRAALLDVAGRSLHHPTMESFG